MVPGYGLHKNSINCQPTDGSGMVPGWFRHSSYAKNNIACQSRGWFWNGSRMVPRWFQDMAAAKTVLIASPTDGPGMVQRWFRDGSVMAPAQFVRKTQLFRSLAAVGGWAGGWVGGSGKQRRATLHSHPCVSYP